MEKKSRKKSDVVNRTYIAVGIIITLFVVLFIGTFVVLNSKSKEVEMPNIVGLSKETAQEEIESANLKFKIEKEEYDKEVPEGYIISQNPKYMEQFNKVKEGSTVSVVISKGQETKTKEVIVVDVIGESEEKAIEKLAILGLKVKVSYSEDTSKDNGIVLKQSISGETTIDEGTTITIIVNKLN